MSASLGPILRSFLQTTAGVSSLAGVLSHHIVFRPYEIDGAAWYLFFTYIGLFVVLCIAYVWIAGFEFFPSLCRTLLVATTYNVSLTASILVYRVFFHRLRSFPGPFLAKLSGFYLLFNAKMNQRGCVDIQELHKKYGDIVRVGPNELSINDHSILQPIFGKPNLTMKSRFYVQTSGGSNESSLNSTRDPKKHCSRKNIWMKPLKPKAISLYEDPVIQRINSLFSIFNKQLGKSIDFTDCIRRFAFDVMGDIGFSKDFGMLKGNTDHPAIKGVQDSMMAIGVYGTVPWLLFMLGKIPGLAPGYVQFTKWCHMQLQEKRKIIASKDEEPRDIISCLLKAMENGDTGAPPSDAAVEEDARLLIIAGSDTVASAITNALFYLSKNPDCYKALQNALSEHFTNGDSKWTYKKACQVPYLDWVIYEVLRLRPPVPGGLRRITLTDEILVGKVSIPKGVVISVPTYTMHHDERHWSEPNLFNPERWNVKKTKKTHWIPFSTGQGACPGKDFAMMVIRMVLAHIVLQYDLSLPKDVTAEEFELPFKDTFTMTLQSLYLVIS